MHTYKQMLDAIRPYTGDAFRPVRGYAANRKPNFGQRMAVLRYFEKVQELTAVDNQVYVPKRGEKTEAFTYTGQIGWRKFTKAIVRKVTPAQDLTFHIDKSRPRGSRFTMVDRNTGREYYLIPAYLFTDVDDFDSPDHAAAEYEEILRTHAGDAEFFLVGAGESYIWGGGGGHEAVAHKIAELFRNYSANHFDANDKRSSYVGNWFRGVTGFRSRFDIIERATAGMRARREYRAKFKMSQTKNYRRLKSGLIGVFENGRLVETIDPAAWSLE